MSVEAELKASVPDVDALRAALTRSGGEPERSVYVDRYFDYPDRRLDEQGYELRVRTITEDDGDARVLLTYKEPAVDKASGSKPEHETIAGDADVLATVLTALGVQQVIAFEKCCENYRLRSHHRDLLATLVTVPELDEQAFIELETIAEENEVDAALDVVRAVLNELGISEDDLTTQTYTGAVAARRGEQ